MILLYFIPFLADCGIGMVLLGMPLICIEKFSASYVYLGIQGAVGALAYILGTLTVSKLSSSVNRDVFIRLSAVLFVIGFSSVPFLPYLFLVLIFFSLGSFAMGMFWPSFQALISDKLQSEGRLFKGLSRFSASWSFGLMAGAFLGGMLIRGGFQRVFLTGVGIFIFSVVLVLVSEKNTHSSCEDVEILSEKAVSSEADKVVMLKVVLLANFSAWFCGSMMRHIFPKLIFALGGAAEMVSWLLLLLALSQGIGFLVFGNKRSESFRLKEMLKMQFIGISGLSIIAFTENLYLYLLSCIILGFQVSFTYQASLFFSVTANSVNKAKNTGIHEAVLGSGFLFGPLIGGMSAQIIGMHAPYAVAMLVVFSVMCLQVYIYRNKKKAAT